MSNRGEEVDQDEGDVTNWVTWRAEPARKIAQISGENNIERWHTSILRQHWRWAGHAVRRPNTDNFLAATAHIAPRGRGRPPPHWAQLLRKFSTQELRGDSDTWIEIAQNRNEWSNMTSIFTEFVEVQFLRADTRATLARDSIVARSNEL